MAELEAEEDLRKLEKQIKKESIDELLRPATEEELLQKVRPCSRLVSNAKPAKRVTKVVAALALFFCVAQQTSIQKKTPLTAASKYDVAAVNEDEIEDLLKPAEPVDTGASAEEVSRIGTRGDLQISSPDKIFLSSTYTGSCHV